MQRSLFASGDAMAVDCGGNLYASGVVYGPGASTLAAWSRPTARSQKENDF
jgi:hypothetical protein